MNPKKFINDRNLLPSFGGAGGGFCHVIARRHDEAIFEIATLHCISLAKTEPESWVLEVGSGKLRLETLRLCETLRRLCESLRYNLELKIESLKKDKPCHSELV